MARRGTIRNMSKVHAEMRQAWAQRAKTKDEPLQVGTEDLVTQYARAAEDVCFLADWIKTEVEDRGEPVTWATVGSLTEIRKQLRSTLAFLTGIGEIEIGQALDELHM